MTFCLLKIIREDKNLKITIFCICGKIYKFKYFVFENENNKRIKIILKVIVFIKIWEIFCCSTIIIILSEIIEIGFGLFA